MSSTKLKSKPSAAHNLDSVGKLHNSDCRSSPQRTGDVPWESASRPESVARLPVRIAVANGVIQEVT